MLAPQKKNFLVCNSFLHNYVLAIIFQRLRCLAIDWNCKMKQHQNFAENCNVIVSNINMKNCTSTFTLTTTYISIRCRYSIHVIFTITGARTATRLLSQWFTNTAGTDVEFHQNTFANGWERSGVFRSTNFGQDEHNVSTLNKCMCMFVVYVLILSE